MLPSNMACNYNLTAQRWFKVKVCQKSQKIGFYPTVKAIKIKYFQNEMMYFNAKFNLNSDFAIKHNLIP